MKDETMYMLVGGFNIFAGLFTLVGVMIVVIRVEPSNILLFLLLILSLVFLATINFVSAIDSFKECGEIK